MKSDGDGHPSRLFLTAPLVLAYLIVDDLCVNRLWSVRHTNLSSTDLLHVTRSHDFRTILWRCRCRKLS
jgi:hypothetical protein